MIPYDLMRKMNTAAARVMGFTEITAGIHGGGVIATREGMDGHVYVNIFGNESMCNVAAKALGDMFMISVVRYPDGWIYTECGKSDTSLGIRLPAYELALGYGCLKALSETVKVAASSKYGNPEEVASVEE